jgi:hypothetical protein
MLCVCLPLRVCDYCIMFSKQLTSIVCSKFVNIESCKNSLSEWRLTMGAQLSLGNGRCVVDFAPSTNVLNVCVWELKIIVRKRQL